MRQSEGSELLGPGNPHSADVGIIYVEPTDSRPEILKAINTQEITGRKQIAIVLLDHHKAFRQPVDFDGLKNLRRGLKAQLVFIAPAGPGPANFARQRNFAVYSDLDSFRQAVLTEGVRPAGGGHVKSKPGGLLGGLGARKGKASAPQSQVPPPAPVGPGPQGFSPPANQQRPASQLPEIDTVKLDQAGQKNAGLGTLAGAAAGALAAGASAAGDFHDEDDEELYQPNPHQGNPAVPTPTAKGSSTGTGPVRRPDSKPLPAGPGIIAFPGTPLATPTTTGKASTQGSKAQASGKLPAAQNPSINRTRGSSKLPPVPGTAASGNAPSQGTPSTPNNSDQTNGQDMWGNTGSDKLPAIAAMAAAGAAAVGPAANPGANASQNAQAAGGVAMANKATATPPLQAAGSPGNVGAKSQPSTLTPLPPPRSRVRTRRQWRLLLILLLVVLLGALAFTVFAKGGPGGILSPSVSAKVIITPDSKLEVNDFVIIGKTSGTPDAADNQVAADQISAKSPTQSATGHATGSISATTASGTLIFQNVGSSSVQLRGGTLTGGDGVEVNFGPVFVPAGGSTTASITGTAAQPGAGGNIKAFDIDGNCCGYSTIFVKNPDQFTGGQDAVPNRVIQKSDITNAANTLIPSLTSDAQGSLQKQVLSNERAVDGSLKCPANTTANQQPGDQVSTVTVQVSVTCTEYVYDYQGANTIAVSALQHQATKDLGSSPQYALDGQIVTGLVRPATVVGTSNQTTIAIDIQAQGLWVYQFTAQMQQNLKQSLVKLSKQAAVNILLHDMGVANAQITLSSGATMPTTANDITLTIQTLPGARITSTPTVINPTNAPSPTPTTDLTGS